MDFAAIVQALLAKAEATEFEHEAAAFLAKAEELMVKHDIARASLPEQDRDKIEKVVIEVGVSNGNRNLWYHAALSRDVKMLINSQQRTTAWLVGFHDDIEYVKALVASLIVQRERYLVKTDKPYWEHAKTFNHGFRMAYAARIADRLKEIRKHSQEESNKTPGNALVLRDKAVQVRDRFQQEFPRIHTIPQARVTSAAGTSAGRQAGSMADLGGHRVTGSRQAISS
jgi:hypothetical protein